MAVIGIDLGTTNSLVSVFRNGKVELIPNSFGEYLTPSVVSFGAKGEVFVGKIAKEMLVTNPKQTFAQFKRNMGTGSTYSAEHFYQEQGIVKGLLSREEQGAFRTAGEAVKR